MGGARADPQLVVRLDDRIEARDVAQIDEQGGLGEPQLDQRKQAVATRQQLGLAFAVLEDSQRLVQVGRTDVVELAGNHRAATLLPAQAGDLGPSGPGTGSELLATITSGGRLAPRVTTEARSWGRVLRASIGPLPVLRQRNG